ncbi:TolC family protein [Parapedobacter koreensis]|uniref:Outer membrane protein TolC n=1 Tax=Parapedobacter koreensis TaxID=332977 RepID=A0A1H7MCH0_9SPHI|nr:TolC family protein [Parapedobacter koreensis]SEL08618.1 Outer membrane protein TolC [Parapedobacter koreensis]
MNIVKMNIRLIIAMVFVGLWSANTASAQEVLTLNDALQYALKNNESVKKAYLDIEGGKHQVAEVRAGALPQVEGSAGLNYNPIIGKLVFAGQSVTIGQPWDSQFGAQLNQQVFNQQVFTGLKAAQATSDYYVLAANMTEEQVIETVASNYYQVLVNKEQLSVIDTNLKNIRIINDVVANQYQNGLAKKIDVDRIKVNITNLETQREELVNGIVLLENRLKFSMGMPIEAPITLAEEELKEVPALTDFDEDDGRLDRLVELQVLNKQLELLDLQYKANKAEYYPSLSLISNYSYTAMASKFNYLYRNSENPVAAKFGSMLVGLSLRVPIFNGFATRARIGKAKVDYLKAEQDLYNMRQSLDLANENAKIQLKNAVNTIHSQRQNMQLAQEVYESTQNNYNNGLAALTDLLDTENALTQAQNSYTQALLNYKIAEIQLKKSNGQIKTLVNE